MVPMSLPPHKPECLPQMSLMTCKLQSMQDGLQQQNVKKKSFVKSNQLVFKLK